MSTLQRCWHEFIDGQPKLRSMTDDEKDRLKRLWLDGAQSMLVALREEGPTVLEARTTSQLKATIEQLNDEVMADIARIHGMRN